MIVFFDIDGTLIDERSQQIPESTVRAVEALSRNGHIPVVNTGRPFTHVDSRVREMAFRGFACGCGMEVQLDGRWLLQLRPEPALCRKVVECSRKYGMRSFYELAEGGLLLDGENSYHPLMMPEVERMRSVGYRICQLADFPEPQFMKLVTFRDEGSDPDAFCAELRSDFTIIDRGGFMYELILKGCSKAAGMQMILDHLGADRQETMAIGDSTNDLTMFQLAGHTVCMGNGMEELKRVSEYVTASVMEDGIEKALQHYGLI